LSPIRGNSKRFSSGKKHQSHKQPIVRKGKKRREKQKGGKVPGEGRRSPEGEFKGISYHCNEGGNKQTKKTQKKKKSPWRDLDKSRERA